MGMFPYVPLLAPSGWARFCCNNNQPQNLTGLYALLCPHSDKDHSHNLEHYVKQKERRKLIIHWILNFYPEETHIVSAHILLPRRNTLKFKGTEKWIPTHGQEETSHIW